MCTVSMMGDQYRKVWPDPYIIPQMPYYPPQPGTTITFTPTKEETALDLLEQLMALAKKLDKVLGLPDCEDPEKTEWIKEVRERVRKHEIEKIDKRLKKK